jgi:hypothetical protein
MPHPRKNIFDTSGKSGALLDHPATLCSSRPAIAGAPTAIAAQNPHAAEAMEPIGFIHLDDSDRQQHINSGLMPLPMYRLPYLETALAH